jgi:carbon storage regulator
LLFDESYVLAITKLSKPCRLLSLNPLHPSSAQGGALLTLTRKIGESIRIGDNIVVVVKEIKGKQVRLGIEAPRDVYVCREELFMKIKQANQGALAPETVNTQSGTPDALTTLGRLLLSRQAPESNRYNSQGDSHKTSGVTAESSISSDNQDQGQTEGGDDS